MTTFNVNRIESAFTGLGGSPHPNTERLQAEITANTTITTVVSNVGWDEPDQPVGSRIIRIVFAGAGPLSAPELTELDTVVIPAHDGTDLLDDAAPITDVVEDMAITYQTADTVQIEVGRVADDVSPPTMLIVIDSPLTLDLTVSGIGGLDTGTKAPNTWYAVHAIGDTRGIAVANVIASLSFSGPTLPAAYDTSRRIGSIKNAAGDVLFKFIQAGSGKERVYFWDEDHEQLPQRVLAQGTSPGSFTAIDLQDVVPESSILPSLQIESGPGNGKSKLRPSGVGGASGTHSIENNSQVADRILAPGQLIDYETTGTSRLTVDVTGFSEDI